MYSYITYFAPLIISKFKDSYGKINMESNKETISRLKFIGKVKKGEKINVKYTYVQPDCLATKISRTLINHDNRCNTLNFVQSTIERTFEILSLYEKSNVISDKIMCYNILQDLKNVKKGLFNLKETYISDVKFCCDMDTLLQTIDVKLVELNPKFSCIENNLE